MSTSRRPVFRIDHPDVKGLMGLSIEEKHFAWKELEPNWQKFYAQATNSARIEASLRTPYDQGLLKLLNAANVYLNIKASVTSVWFCHSHGHSAGERLRSKG